MFNCCKMRPIFSLPDHICPKSLQVYNQLNLWVAFMFFLGIYYDFDGRSLIDNWLVYSNTTLSSQISPPSTAGKFQIWQQLRHYSQFPDFGNYLAFILARAEVFNWLVEFIGLVGF
ncbi:hypothetical protein Pint_28674 [Pistacia integerrima]|uniref:Uncharacterized protein n=1 Tax=Pistacia integerrima TaxID=434235 RepID=A0ACC0YN64_9ROSI|nr:hypothetical protein Pint_28674 [Pistacia integerrima]